MIQSRNSTQGKDKPTDQAKGRGVARTSSSRSWTPTPTSWEAGLNPQRACLQEVGPLSPHRCC